MKRKRDKSKGKRDNESFNHKKSIIPKSIMPINVAENKFQKFRGQIYNQIKQRADSVMDLLDALCSNNKTTSVVQLSLNPLFRRGYSAVFKAISGLSFWGASPEENEQTEDIETMTVEPMALLELIAEVVPSPQERPFFCSV
jgi:hypothetical protein